MTNPPPPPRSFGDILRDGSTWGLLFLFLVGGVLAYSILFRSNDIGRFAEHAYARGVITFIITLATVAIAFVLIYQASSTGANSDDSFRRSREIFTGLMGVLGTIVGFYFGTTADAATRLTMADLRLEDGRLGTFVSGGAPPYRYTITVDSDTLAAGTSPDGFILHTLEPPPTPEQTLTVEAADSRNQDVSQELKVPSASDAQPPAPVDSPPQR